MQEIKAAARAAGFTGQTSQSALLTYWTFKSRLQAFATKLYAKAKIGDKGDEGSDAIGTLHVAHFVGFENNHLGFFTIFDGDFAKYIQDFADKNSLVFDTLFPHIDGAPPTPVAKNAQAFYQWALEANHPPIGFYSAYPGLAVQDIRALHGGSEVPVDHHVIARCAWVFADCLIEGALGSDRRSGRSMTGRR